MSVVTARRAAPLAGPFHDMDDAFNEDIDWGSATPINTIAELELDNAIHSGILKRKTKTVSFSRPSFPILPKHQKGLLLQALRQPFVLEAAHPVPEVRKGDEIIVKIQAVGLNPIDWKSADYGYSIPVLPYVSGRDFAGIVVQASADAGNIKLGDVILCPSTDYRDLRKAAYQEYAIATTSTVCRIPAHVSTSQGAALGVAYVAAALALSICLGLRLPSVGSSKGPDLLEIVRNTPLGRLPRDTVAECLIEDAERPKPGDWMVIWGGSSTSALFLSQFARLAGLRVVLVLDIAKHGSRLQDAEGLVFVDSHSSERAVEVIQGVTGGNVRFGVDTVGPKTAEHLARALQTTDSANKTRSHLVGLAAVPKERLPKVSYHAVPVKLFHEVPDIGLSLMAWLERALETRLLELPRIEEVSGGLYGINSALDRMRKGQISGKRLVVPV